ncbi:general stress protein 26 [Bradyrhizobium elkanii]|nr:pyridoxamine 5'-phosphate oxidase family protein [Bradyrhizobium elkanii]MBP2434034.1 general stress protein 26 [Bradyrhizobium elkanii]WLA89028.1 pyridoxamine 5'-phosphate oxidase family protein [Bradyrhizobium elkanii]
MSSRSLADIAKEMAGIDIAILSTHGDKWFANGVDTPGIVLIKVKAKRATYWKGSEEGELLL